MDIREIFENRIKIESKQISIDSLFNNEDRVNNTNYSAYYQRNYVWDDEKATYFIESILLGTEIPPLIYYRDGEKVEVIDGRQRYETLKRYLNDEFKLKKNGLHKLDLPGIANKSFETLGEEYKHLMWDTKIRTIEFSFHTASLKDDDTEEAVKKEIFKRYNSGITPLKPSEIDKAAYIDDDLNSYFKDRLHSDRLWFAEVTSSFHFEKSNDEVILKKIRQLLVLHKIPIKYFAVKKDNIISKYYDYLSLNLSPEEIPEIYKRFVTKINLISRVRKELLKNNIQYNRLISEALFWAFSIIEEEDTVLLNFNNNQIARLVNYLQENISYYEVDRSSFYGELTRRYIATSVFFKSEFNISFDAYLYTSPEFLQQTKDISVGDLAPLSFEDLRINKPEPSATAIMDICRQMTRQRFIIRPAYQRNEVINQRKSSSIIESILLGIKLPPIFVYIRPDSISEVLDGQQRLLSILGFIGESYLDENNEAKQSTKHEFKLHLKNGILSGLHGKRFKDLTQTQQSKIRNFDLWIIEINHKNNLEFEPIDLFLRLNSKPYPIKDDTFEMWNSYISRDIISSIKSAYSNEKNWFYIRKNNSRMENENIYTTLAYFQYNWYKTGKSIDYKPEELGIYTVGDKISYRVKSKNDISKVLENPDNTDLFIEAINDLEFDFINKLKTLLTDTSENNITLHKNLDEIFNDKKGLRTQQSFYALWHFMFNIPIDEIKKNKFEIRQELRLLFDMISGIDVQGFNLDKFKKKYLPNFVKDYEGKSLASLAQIADIKLGTIPDPLIKGVFSTPITYLKKGSIFKRFNINLDDLRTIDIADNFPLFKLFEAKNKILIKRTLIPGNRLSIALSENPIAFGSETIGVNVNRAGFSKKYLLCILYSRYSMRQILNYASGTLEDQKVISPTSLKEIKVPSIPMNQQIVFDKILDLLSSVEEESPAFLFLERLLDAMVYELFFESNFSKANIRFRKLIELELNQKPITTETAAEFYLSTIHPQHEIASNLLRLLSIPEVQDFESHVM
jgi:hypothetical protein